MRLMAIDTETTGLQGKVCEIGAAVFNPENPAFNLHIEDLVYPGEGIEPSASAVHHLVDSDLHGKPVLHDVWGKYTGKADIFVAHNAKFDRSMLPETDKPWICTLKLAKHFYPGSPNHKLQVLRYWIKLEVDTPEHLHPHRALYDAICCAELYKHMQKQFGFTDQEAIEISNAPLLLKTMPFGKYKGRPMSDVIADTGYVNWIFDQSDMGEDIIYSIQYWQRVEK